MGNSTPALPHADFSRLYPLTKFLEAWDLFGSLCILATEWHLIGAQYMLVKVMNECIVKLKKQGAEQCL